MNLQHLLISTLLIFGLSEFAMAASPADIAKKITWFGQSCVRIEAGGKIIYTDPAYIATAEKADIVLITHHHSDHYNKQAITKLGPPTVLIGGFDFVEHGGIEGGIRMLPGETKVIDGITIKAVTSYNVVKNIHPKASNFVGFLITVEGVTIYIPGDTELIPEMKDIKCDIAFMPLGTHYTMRSVADAVQAVIDVGATIAFPYHWGSGEGTKADANKFVDALVAKGIQAAILPAQ